ncbi:hypothetical protein RB195_015859 [Necator americanus]|uniref:IST1 homolog n=1 Tax=Necator americanus TaxID=51031 RepID=A0ABR1E6G5_NECAM
MAMKARTEIAAYISDNKADRARIRVEHIIREDYLVEAFEILEMYCDLLLARFGLIEQMKTLDDGIAEAVISIMWAAPRIATDIAEFKTISDQLTIKYGKPFAEAARANQLEFPAKVSPKLISKLSVSAPPKVLVERYMIEIAASAGVPFTPDPDVMRDDEVAQAEKMLIDFKQTGAAGLNEGAPVPPPNVPQIPPQPSDNVNYGWNLPSGPPPGHFPPPNIPPPPGPGSENGGGSGGSHIYEVPNIAPPSYGEYSTPPQNVGPHYTPGMVQLPKIGPDGLPVYSAHDGPTYPALSQRNSMIEDKKPIVPPHATSSFPSAPPQTIKNQNEAEEWTFPEPPSTFNEGPGNSGGGGGSGGGGELDFDELARRFDQLKKK